MTAVRPPEFAPRLEWAALLLAADRVVLADTFPYSRQSGHSRTRVRAASGAQWLSVPRRHAGLGQPLDRVEVAAGDWRRKHRAALQAAYGRAPFFEHVAPEWDAVLDTPGSLADLSCASVAFAARWLRSGAEVVRASELPGRPAGLAEVVDEVGVERLLTLPESAERDAAAVDVPVSVLAFEERPRAQAFPGFVAGLGVLDLFMVHGPASADVLRQSVG